MLRHLGMCALILAAHQASASPIAGEWQGPCENRNNHSVKFNYVISEADADGEGVIRKTKTYYRGLDCQTYNRTGRKSVAYIIGEPSEEGIYPFDVRAGRRWFYDIVHLSDDGLVLTFGDRYGRTSDTRPTELSTTDRVFELVEAS